MDIEAREWVVYHPPKSVAFGHQCRIRDPRRAWPLVEQFVVGWTKYSFGQHVTLVCSSASPQTDAEVAESRLTEARRIFGLETSAPQVFSSWNLRESQIASAIEFALDNDKFPKQQMPPAVFSFAYRFVWKEFEEGAEQSAGNESRNPTSTLGVSIGFRGLFLQPHFIFPAPSNSEFLKKFIGRLDPAVPFRFRDQYFKRWLPPKNAKTGFGRYLKLDPNWRY